MSLKRLVPVVVALSILAVACGTRSLVLEGMQSGAGGASPGMGADAAGEGDPAGLPPHGDQAGDDGDPASLPPRGDQVMMTVDHVHQFSAPVRVTWSVVGGPAAGYIDDSGLYTAPAAAGTFQVRAVSTKNTSFSTTFDVVVRPTGVTRIAAEFSSPKGISVQDAQTAWVTDARRFLLRVNLGSNSVDALPWTAPGGGTISPPSGVLAFKGALYTAQGCSFQKAVPATATVQFLNGGGPGGCSPGTPAVGVYGLVTDGTTLYWDYPDLIASGLFSKRLGELEANYEFTVIAGNRALMGEGAQDGVGPAARINGPRGLALDGKGGLFFADQLNHVIRRIDLASGLTSTFAGALGKAGAVDGSLSSARFDNPQGIAYDGRDSLYVADHGNGLIRRISLAGGQVMTVAGTVNRFAVTEGPLPSSVGHPAGIAMTADGDVLATAYEENAVILVRVP